MVDDDALGDTLLGSAAPPPSAPAKVVGITMRATVLPRTDTTNQPRYEPIKIIGRGGVGEVTLARDNDIDRPVAVKRLRPEAAEHGLHRFVHEIRTVGVLEHPNIAPIHDVGIDDEGNHYFVMRYIDGETLEAVIAKLAAGDPGAHRRFTFEQRVQLFLGVINAVQFAHSKGIIHRDIKPANIMIGPYGEVVVMDWGIAKKLGAPEMDHVGALVGTPAYMSPEQARGETAAIDARSDVYSLCVLFYELLALQHYLPARGTLQEMLVAIQKDEHELASHLAHPHQAPVPAELSWFIEKGLEKDPDARYQSLEEMHDELQRVMSGGFAVRCYVTLMKKTGTTAVRFIDAHPRIALSGGVVAILMGLIGIISLVQHAL